MEDFNINNSQLKERDDDENIDLHLRDDQFSYLNNTDFASQITTQPNFNDIQAVTKCKSEFSPSKTISTHCSLTTSSSQSQFANFITFSLSASQSRVAKLLPTCKNELPIVTSSISFGQPPIIPDLNNYINNKSSHQTPSIYKQQQVGRLCWLPQNFRPYPEPFWQENLKRQGIKSAVAGYFDLSTKKLSPNQIKQSVCNNINNLAIAELESGRTGVYEAGLALENASQLLVGGSNIKDLSLRTYLTSNAKTTLGPVSKTLASLIVNKPNLSGRPFLTADNKNCDDNNNQISVYNITQSRQRKRTHYTQDQLNSLERLFQKNHYPNSEEKRRLSYNIDIDEAKIHVWFQNRRSRENKAKKYCAKRPKLGNYSADMAQHYESSINGNDTVNQLLITQPTLNTKSNTGSNTFYYGANNDIPRSGCYGIYNANTSFNNFHSQSMNQQNDLRENKMNFDLAGIYPHMGLECGLLSNNQLQSTTTSASSHMGFYPNNQPYLTDDIEVGRHNVDSVNSSVWTIMPTYSPSECFTSTISSNDMIHSNVSQDNPNSIVDNINNLEYDYDLNLTDFQEYIKRPFEMFPSPTLTLDQNDLSCYGDEASSFNDDKTRCLTLKDLNSITKNLNDKSHEGAWSPNELVCADDSGYARSAKNDSPRHKSLNLVENLVAKSSQNLEQYFNVEGGKSNFSNQLYKHTFDMVNRSLPPTSCGSNLSPFNVVNHSNILLSNFELAELENKKQLRSFDIFPLTRPSSKNYPENDSSPYSRSGKVKEDITPLTDMGMHATGDKNKMLSSDFGHIFFEAPDSTTTTFNDETYYTNNNNNNNYNINKLNSSIPYGHRYTINSPSNPNQVMLYPEDCNFNNSPVDSLQQGDEALTNLSYPFLDISDFTQDASCTNSSPLLWDHIK